MSIKKPYKVIHAEPANDQERFERNMKLIEQKNPDVAKQFRDIVITNINMISSSTGRTTGAIWDVKHQQWVQLHNFEDPIAEASRDADSVYTPNQKVFTLIGCGLGYLAVELAKRMRPHQKLAIFERNPQLFKAAMYACDLTEVLGEHRVDTFIGDSVIANMENYFLSFNTHEKFYIAPPIRSGYTGSYDAEFHELLTGKLVDMMRYHAVGLATWQQFGAAIGNNDIANAPEYLITPGLNELAGVWEGKPAVCVAAGPSLRKNLKYLLDPEVRNRVCVLAVGTVYGLLRSMGIVPDIVTSIDFQRLNWTDQFRLFPQDRRTALVYLHSVYPQIPRRWPGPKFVARNSSDTTEWLATFCEPKATAGSVQTVAHLNVVTALMMKANPIILLGQDLSMPPTEHHAPGAQAQDTTPTEAPDSCIEAIDIYGNVTQTRHSFLSMRTVFAQMFAANPGTQFLNCTEGGINIDNATNANLSDVVNIIKTQVPKNEINAGEIILNIFLNYKSGARYKEFVESLDIVSESLKKITEVSRLIDTVDLSNFYDSAKREQIVKVATTVEAESAKIPAIAMSMICVRRYDIVVALSEIEPNGPGVSDVEVLKFRVNRTFKICRAIIDEHKHILNNIKRTRSRVADLLNMTSGGYTVPNKNEILRLFGRQSYIPAYVGLSSQMQDMGDSLFTTGDLKNYIRLQARLAFHLQEYQKAYSILNTHQFDTKLQARCQRYLDRYMTSMLKYILPYFKEEDAKISMNTNFDRDLG